MDNREILAEKLWQELLKIHEGKSMQITINPEIDANTLQFIRTTLENQYRKIFNEELAIEDITRDSNRVLHISMCKKSADTEE